MPSNAILFNSLNNWKIIEDGMNVEMELTIQEKLFESKWNPVNIV